MRKKLYKRLLIVLVFAYAIFTLANQQKTINQYNKNSRELASKINEQEAYHKELEQIGLAAPQVTYVMEALEKEGFPVNTSAITVEQAADEIMRVLR